MKKPLLFMKDNYFTKEQRARLLKIFGGDQKTLSYFCSMIAPAIYYASGKRGATPPERRQSRKAALISANRFKRDLEKSDIFWELWITKEGFSEWWALILLTEKLEKSLDQLPPNEKSYSRYKPLAAAVGKTMVECGLEVTHYASAIHGSKGEAAQVIEICIEAAGLPLSSNLKDLSGIAKKAANKYLSAAI